MPDLFQPLRVVFLEDLDDPKMRAAVREIEEAFNVLIEVLETEDWHDLDATGEPALASDWVNAGGSHQDSRFRKTAFEVCYLEGAVTSATETPPSTIYTLPIDYRPASDLRFPVIVGTGQQVLIVRSTGVVEIQGGTLTNPVHTEGVAFYALGS